MSKKSKVIELNKVKNEPDKEVIDQLKELLKKAKKGQVTGLGVIAIDDSYDVDVRFSGKSVARMETFNHGIKLLDIIYTDIVLKPSIFKHADDEAEDEEDEDE